MADQKISELTALTGANVADDDAIAIVDTSATETKKIVFSELKTALDTATGFVRITGDTMTGDLALSGADVTFGDNDKAIFGAGSDLQIYHDGSASYIDDAGTGALYIRGNAIVLEKYTGERLLDGTGDAAVKLYYDNAVKLATTSTGVDITGAFTATTTGTVPTIYGGSGASQTFTLQSTSGNSNHSKVLIGNAVGADNGGISFYSAGTSVATERMRISGTNGDISFYDSLGSSQSFFWDASAEKLLIGDTSNSTASGLYIKTADPTDLFTGQLVLKGTALTGAADTGASIVFEGFNGSGNRTLGSIQSLKENSTVGDSLAYMRFSTYGSSGTQERMRIDSSGNVGIGTSSPQQLLHVYGNSPIIYLETSDSRGQAWQIRSTNGATAASGTLSFRDEAGNTWLDFANNGGSNQTKFYTGGSERMRIDSSGNVGIGTSSMGYPAFADNLTIADSANSGITIRSGSTNEGSIYFSHATGSSLSTYAGYINYNHSSDIMRFATSSTVRAVIDSSGRVGIGTSSPQRPLHVNGVEGVARFTSTASGNNGFEVGIGTSSQAFLWQSENSYMQFATNATERMRIDSSGNLLVGKTSSSIANDGFQVHNTGYIGSTNSGASTAYFNRKTDDGDIVNFQKDGTTVGSIGALASALTIGSGDTGLFFQPTFDRILPCTITGNTGRDDAIDLGASTTRFDDIYATNGTIQTSDRNEKQDIAELSDAEQRVAVAAKGLLRKFRWRDSVEAKGNEARTHFGIIAQDLQAAFAAEGLDAGDYAMFISSTWTDEETGEERTRMGVRYSELLAFIIAAI